MDVTNPFPDSVNLNGVCLYIQPVLFTWILLQLLITQYKQNISLIITVSAEMDPDLHIRLFEYLLTGAS